MFRLRPADDNGDTRTAESGMTLRLVPIAWYGRFDASFAREGAATVNRIIASVAVILCLFAQSTLDAQQRRPATVRSAGGPSASSPSANGSTAGRAGQAQSSQPTRVVRSSPAATRPQSNAGRRPAQAKSAVKRASYGEIVYEDGGYGDGEYIDQGGHHGGYIDQGIVSGGCQSCDGGGCSSCSSSGHGGSCTTCAAPNQFCICFPSHGWVHAEYLSWYPAGMQIPALVTSSPAGTARANAGVLGQPGTSVLYGGDEIMDDSWAGFRIRFGWWLASLPGWGLEGEYTGLGERSESFFQQSTGTPIIARPFFNALTGKQDSELVAFPGVIGGSMAVDATSRFDGAAVRLRRQMCSTEGCGYSFLACQTVPTSSRLDTTIGYRFWELRESLQMQERLTSQLTNDPGSFNIVDRFDTRNLFNGAELGVLWQGRRGWWSLDLLMRLGIGNNNQTVTIDGSTATTINNNTTNASGGVLAQRTNMGTYERNQFTMVPELGATLGYQITPRLRATAGYSLVYIGNVVRPGDQVSLDVNPNLLPPENVPLTGALRPQFNFVETDYLIQGLNFGGEFRW